LLFRLVLNVSLLLAGVGMTGCHSMSRVSEGVQPGGTFEMRFSPARTIEARRPDGSRISLPAVREADVQALSVRGDSVTVEIEEWEGGSPVDEHREAAGTQATFSSNDPEVSFFQNRISVTKNLLAVGVVIGLVALAIGQASVGGY
jgi:hypothetical protein